MAVAVVALVLAHLRSTGLSPIHNAVSQYGISPAAAFYRVQTLAMALAALALAIGVPRCLHGRGVDEVVVCLLLFAVTRALISWFPMDAPGAPRSRHGSTHGILAIGAFLSIGVAAVRLNALLDSPAVVSWWHHVSVVASAALTVTLVTMFVARFSLAVRRYFGLFERLFYLSCIAWIGSTCWACATVPRW